MNIINFENVDKPEGVDDEVDESSTAAGGYCYSNWSIRAQGGGGCGGSSYNVMGTAGIELEEAF